MAAVDRLRPGGDGDGRDVARRWPDVRPDTHAAPARRVGPAHARHASTGRPPHPDPPPRLRVNAVLAEPPGGSRRRTGGRLAASTDAPGMPTCCARHRFRRRPTRPGSATASLSWPPSPTARCWPATTSGPPTIWCGRRTSKTFDLYPWQSKIYDITGWVTGLLQLPSLTAEIPPQDIVFCDNQGAPTACRRTGRPASASRSRPSTAPRRPARRRPRPSGTITPKGQRATDTPLRPSSASLTW